SLLLSSTARTGPGSSPARTPPSTPPTRPSPSSGASPSTRRSPPRRIAASPSSRSRPRAPPPARSWRSPPTFGSASSAAADARRGLVVGELEGLEEVVLPHPERDPPERRLAVVPEHRGARRQRGDAHASRDVLGDGRSVREDRDRLVHRCRRVLARRREP